jgi:hypothetical protein
MFNWIQRGVFLIACAVGVFPLGPCVFVNAADAPAAPYVLRGDISEIKSKGFIRFLVHGEADYLPRTGDPRAAERALAEEFAIRFSSLFLFP